MAQCRKNQLREKSKQYQVCFLLIINIITQTMDSSINKLALIITQNNETHSKQHLRIRIKTKPDNILFEKATDKIPRLIIKPIQPKTPKLIFYTGRKKPVQNKEIIIIEDDHSNNQVTHSPLVIPDLSLNKNLRENNLHQKIESNKVKATDSDRKKYFDCYINQQIEKNFGNPNQPNKLHIKTWEQLKQCIKFNRDLNKFYHCPYQFCSFCDDRQINLIANCYVKHFDKNFFTCPGCKEKFEKYKILKDHYLTECALYNSQINDTQHTIRTQKITTSYQPGIRPHVIFLNDTSQSPKNYYAYQLNHCSYDVCENYLEEINFTDF